jgi:hypothetical protein
MSRNQLRKTRKVAFSDKDMHDARDSGRFNNHRHFVVWLFESQHHCVVKDFEKLRFTYYKGFTTVLGEIGVSLVE